MGNNKEMQNVGKILLEEPFVRLCHWTFVTALLDPLFHYPADGECYVACYPVQQL